MTKTVFDFVSDHY